MVASICSGSALILNGFVIGGCFSGIMSKEVWSCHSFCFIIIAQTWCDPLYLYGLFSVLFFGFK